MPRYYFHFRAGSSTLKDEVGEVLADASTALQHARRIALELARGGESTNASIIVIGRFSKFRYPNWATETAACYAPPNIAGRQFSSLPERWVDPRQVSSNPLPGERANATRPRGVRVGRNIAARNRRVRTRKPHNRALGQQAQRQGWPLPPVRRQSARQESHDAIERPPSLSSQPRRLRPLRQVRV
jgi:hypothetical protein